MSFFYVPLRGTLDLYSGCFEILFKVIKMNIKHIAMQGLLVGTLLGCGEPEEEIDPRIPIVSESYQQIIFHPSYLSGESDLSYTLFSDTDSNGVWNNATKVTHYDHEGVELLERECFFNKNESNYSAGGFGYNTKIVGPDFFSLVLGGE